MDSPSQTNIYFDKEGAEAVSFVNQDGDGYISEQSKRLKVEALARQYNVDENKLRWKIDLCVVPAFSLLYYIAYLNRTSFGLVLLDGITESLNITQWKYCCAYVAFLVPYVFFQFFSNILLKNVRPHFWISIAVLIYGSMTLASGFSKTYGQYVAIQFIHGVFQSATDTAIFYIMAHYYERTESQKRFGVIYSVTALSAMTGNLINYRIRVGPLNGHLGLEPWRWLLIIEGSMSAGLALVLFFILPDFPEGARFFNDSETIFLVKKLEVFSGKSGYNLSYTRKDVLATISDPLIYLPALASFGISFLFHGYSFYEPVIAVRLGFNAQEISILTAYVYAAAFAYTNIISFLSDYFKHRYLFLLGNILLAMLGTILTFADDRLIPKNPLKIVATNFMASGSTAAIPILLCWSTANMCGHLRKSVAISLEVALGSLGGLVATFALQKNDYAYHQGLETACGFCGICLIFSTAYLVVLHRENKKKRSSLYKDNFEQKSERQKVILGDKNPLYDYMY